MSRTSITTVVVQLLCIALLVLTGPVIPQRPIPLALAGAGVLLTLWAVAVMGVHNVRATPDVPEHARLVTKGPYKVVRHPMYTGGMLTAAGWVWNDFTVIRMIVALILLLDYIVKLRYEEKLLKNRFPEYADYSRRTKRLVPFVY